MASLGVGEKLIFLLIGAYFLHKYFGTQLTLAVFVGGVTYMYISGKRSMKVWEKLGVPGPSPMFFFGNMLDFYIKGGIHKCEIAWNNKYGNVWGCYMMGSPTLYIVDLDLMKQVLVKDFPYFTNRMANVMEYFISPLSILSNGINMMVDERWKNVRSTITPTFTAGKLKLMAPLIENREKDLSEVLEEKIQSGNKMFEAKELFAAYTLDVICAVAFGTEVNSLKNPDDPFIKKLRESTNFSITNPRLLLRMICPSVVRMIENHTGVDFVMGDIETFFRKYLSSLIAERRKQEKTTTIHRDFLQLMVDNEEDVSAPTENTTSEDGTATVGKRVTLSEEVIMAQCFIFMLAGFETTAVTLQFCAYLLTTHQDVQDRCREEILRVAGKDGPIDWDTVQHKMPYLDAVIAETLRFYPVASPFDRSCSTDYALSDTITIPKGCNVFVSAYLIHHNEEYYPDPERFDPERLVESQSNPSTDPLILWLNGGPGCSSLTGLLFENGPLHTNQDNSTLYENVFSWNKFANVLYLEAPAGVGFSYASDGNLTSNDTQTAEENYAALKVFLNRFPEYKGRDFYITGESYAGVYIPTLTMLVVTGMNQKPPDFLAPLKGIAIGNGILSQTKQDDSVIDFLYFHGLIGDKYEK